jgi:hypothetical protein
MKENAEKNVKCQIVGFEHLQNYTQKPKTVKIANTSYQKKV